MKKTSLDTYKKIKEEGLLSRKRFEVYNYIYKRKKPVTIKEAHNALGNGCAGGTVTSRFSELESMGVIRVVGEDKTGKNVQNLYSVTGSLPSKYEKPMSRSEKLTMVVRSLNAIVQKPKCTCGVCQSCIARITLERIGEKKNV